MFKHSIFFFFFCIGSYCDFFMSLVAYCGYEDSSPTAPDFPRVLYD